MAWLNEKRQDLRKLGLHREEFSRRIRDYVGQYHVGPLLQQAALDRFRAARALRMVQEPLNELPRQRERVGPWNMSDHFWPLAEKRLHHFRTEASTLGGMRAIAAQHRTWQDNVLAVPNNPRPDVKPADLGDPCCVKHPGKCVTGDKDIKKPVDYVVKVQHSIRPLE